MKPLLPLLVFLLSLFSCTAVAQQSRDFYAHWWSKVYYYEMKGLPRSAMSITDTLYRRAKRDQNIPQLIKTLFYQSKFAMLLQEDAEPAIFSKFEKEIADSKPPLKNLLHAVTADLYWQYFQDHRDDIYRRTTTGEKVNIGDLHNWDVDTFFRKIHDHYQQSLAGAALLQSVRLSSIDELLAKAENSKEYRPTLYDFIAHNALDFYGTGEHMVQKPIAHFTISDPRYFTDFEFLPLSSADSLASPLHALKIYRSLLAFHQARRDTTALAQLEIERLEYLAREGSVANAELLHKDALNALRARYRKHPVTTQVDYALAMVLHRESSLYDPETARAYQFRRLEARDICLEAIAAWPESEGALKCQTLNEHLLGKSLTITTEAFLPIDKPARMLVSYTNIDTLWLTAYRVSNAFARKFNHLSNDSARLAQLDSLAATRRWRAGLRNLNDLRVHDTEILLPGLPQGTYLLAARLSATDDGSTFAYTSVQVTNLVLVENKLGNMRRYQVVDRNTGSPLAGASVQYERWHNNEPTGVEENFTTDKQGFFEIATTATRGRWRARATVRFKNDEGMFGDYNTYYYDHDKDDDKATARVFLFTDRAIYRPGQTVFFKGIMVQQVNKKSSVVAGQYVKIMLENVNGKDVGTQRLKTNAFGSVSGEFTLPSTELTGRYALRADEDDEEESKFYDNLDNFDYSDVSISVEEYKRPTFETSFKPVKETFAINDTVTCRGAALAFNGAKISGANVRYSVTRKVRFPRWYYWYYPHLYAGDHEIGHGETTTGQDGEFTIDFLALPDDDVAKKDRPVFVYEVTADVTDVNGETRRATSEINVGYHSLEARLTLPPRISRQTPVQRLGVTTENLNGQEVPARGTVRVYKLATAPVPQRPRPWNSPELQGFTEAAFRELFPHDPYTADDGADHKWRKGKMMLEAVFNTATSKEIPFSVSGNRWEHGSYIAELEATDANGERIIDMQRFDVFDPLAKTVADNDVLFFELDKRVYHVGEMARLQVGSASPDITIAVYIERNGKIAKTYVDHFDNNIKEYTIPVTEAMGEGFSVHCHAVNYNAYFGRQLEATIASKQETLTVETITFHDKLKPGAKETWSFEVKGDGAEQKEAEVLASMYDASLDQFTTHRWSFNPMPHKRYYSSASFSAYQSFDQEFFEVQGMINHYYQEIPQNFDQLDWFGFSLEDHSYHHREYMDRLYYASTSPLEGASVVSISNTRNLKKGFIYGHVKSSDGSSLAGVSVTVKGTLRGTTSDDNGNYRLEAAKGETLAFSFVGFVRAEARVTRKNTMDVVMQEDITQLSEVVVVGYGSIAKASLTGSVSYTTIEDAGEVVFSESLAEGKAAGVQVHNATGGLYSLSIRGNQSLGGAGAPLFVVDGVVVPAYTVAEGDLQSAEVLKGSAATALYGSRAANGVIVVTTKSGQRRLDEEMAKITARKNFNETAFFFPHLRTDPEGKIRFTFTTPESLTRWKLQLLAHTRDLASTIKTWQAVSQKELMVTPNPPRFVRTGDTMVFAAKISNLTDKKRDGTVALQLTNAVTGEPVDAAFQNTRRNLAFQVGAKGSTEATWKLTVPPGIDAVQYKIVAKAGNYSDGEQNALPVLSDKILVTESLPMTVRAGETRSFSLEKLKTTNSATLQHHQLTLEVTSTPAWYAVQALPYLMEFPHECAEQTFARYYANTLAAHIANSNPAIRRVFDQWASSGELVSNLEKNADLKSIVIQETPWLREAQSETEQKKRIALLFELNALKEQQQGALNKLTDMQMADGGFPWFAGAQSASPYITRHIAAGYGHLLQLKAVAADGETARIMNKAVDYLDRQIADEYNQLLRQAGSLRDKETSKAVADRQEKEFLERQHVQDHHIHYLYMRSFYQTPLPENVRPAAAYYRQQSARYWQQFAAYVKGMIALVHQRDQNTALARDIIRSVKENAIVSPALGMYWKENTGGWRWNEAPVETQALLIEAIGEVEAGDARVGESERLKTIDDLRLWLLMNKQTSQWRTTKATTEAIYALLLQGTPWLSVEEAVHITAGGKTIVPDARTPEAGTGYFKTTWKGADVKPALADVTLAKKDGSSAWAGLYWQYFQTMDNITAAETPLKLSKKIFVVGRSEKGELLTEVKKGAPVKVGDLLRIRIELSSDRDMEFLHMKDQRAAGLEPVDVLSAYKWQKGLGYYQSTKDAATHFFFDVVPKGQYVFEYDLRANNKGDFANGITTIQCMYAPEFGSHSEGVRMVVE